MGSNLGYVPLAALSAEAPVLEQHDLCFELQGRSYTVRAKLRNGQQYELQPCTPHGHDLLSSLAAMVHYGHANVSARTFRQKGNIFFLQLWLQPDLVQCQRTDKKQKHTAAVLNALQPCDVQLTPDQWEQLTHDPPQYSLAICFKELASCSKLEATKQGSTDHSSPSQASTAIAMVIDSAEPGAGSPSGTMSPSGSSQQNTASDSSCPTANCPAFLENPLTTGPIMQDASPEHGADNALGFASSNDSNLSSPATTLQPMESSPQPISSTPSPRTPTNSSAMVQPSLATCQHPPAEVSDRPLLAATAHNSTAAVHAPEEEGRGVAPSGTLRPQGAEEDALFCEIAGGQEVRTSFYGTCKPRGPQPRASLCDLPEEVLTHIMSQLTARECAHMSSTCRYLCDVVCLAVPGLNLTLFPHQSAAVRWMLKKERKREDIVSPLIKEFKMEDGLVVYANLGTGQLSVEAPPVYPAVRGGLFCDEPGLGKTVTALALILKTKGCLPALEGLKQTGYASNGSKPLWYQDVISRPVETNPSMLEPAPPTANNALLECPDSRGRMTRSKAQALRVVAQDGAGVGVSYNPFLNASLDPTSPAPRGNRSGGNVGINDVNGLVTPVSLGPGGNPSQDNPSTSTGIPIGRGVPSSSGDWNGECSGGVIHASTPALSRRVDNSGSHGAPKDTTAACGVGGQPLGTGAGCVLKFTIVSSNTTFSYTLPVSASILLSVLEQKVRDEVNLELKEEMKSGPGLKGGVPVVDGPSIYVDDLMSSLHISTPQSARTSLQYLSPSSQLSCLKSEEPPSTLPTPASTSGEPSSTPLEPPSTPLQPQSTPSQPPSTLSQPLLQPQSTPSQPPSTLSQHLSQPQSTPSQPPSTLSQPLSQPQSTPSQPPSTLSQPQSIPSQPPCTLSQPPSSPKTESTSLQPQAIPHPSTAVAAVTNRPAAVTTGPGMDLQPSALARSPALAPPSASAPSSAPASSPIPAPLSATVSPPALAPPSAQTQSSAPASPPATAPLPATTPNSATESPPTPPQSSDPASPPALAPSSALPQSSDPASPPALAPSSAPAPSSTPASPPMMAPPSASASPPTPAPPSTPAPSSAPAQPPAPALPPAADSAQARAPESHNTRSAWLAQRIRDQFSPVRPLSLKRKNTAQRSTSSQKRRCAVDGTASEPPRPRKSGRQPTPSSPGTLPNTHQVMAATSSNPASTGRQPTSSSPRTLRSTRQATAATTSNAAGTGGQPTSSSPCSKHSTRQAMASSTGDTAGAGKAATSSIKPTSFQALADALSHSITQFQLSITPTTDPPVVVVPIDASVTRAQIIEFLRTLLLQAGMTAQDVKMTLSDEQRRGVDEESCRKQSAAAASGSQRAGPQGERGTAQDEEVYVQCDGCKKWRRLPAALSENLDDVNWYCQMHPSPDVTDCSSMAHVQGHGDQGLSYCDGYVAEDEAKQQEANVEFFVDLLQEEPGLMVQMGKKTSFDCRGGVLGWLMDANPRDLRTRGVVIHHTNGYTEFLKKLHLVNERPGNAAGRNKRQKSSSGQNRPSGRWWTADICRNLLLDVPALQEAVYRLRNGQVAVKRKVFVSSATLVVVPATLVQHWIDQIERHVQPGLLKVLVLPTTPDYKNEPSASALACNYDLVITTFERFSGERKRSVAGKQSAFLQVHWLRMIMDEGHTLGASLSLTNKLETGIAIKAERRWVMTGTPTRSSEANDRIIASMQPLLALLHHQPYGLVNGWPSTLHWAPVSQAFTEGKPEGKRHVMNLLKDIMIRSSKSDLVLLPKCTRTVTFLDFAPSHGECYNELVELVRRNLVLADWLDQDHVESLLNKNQATWSKEMFRNVRMSCCVAGHTMLRPQEQDILETLQLLAGRWGHPHPVQEHTYPFLNMDHPLARIEEAIMNGANCELCAQFTKMPIITPCKHILCLDCTAPSLERCPLPSCGLAYEMQSVDHQERRRYNPNPKWAVPKELIEWQCVYAQAGATGVGGGHWQAEWQNTKSTKCVHLLNRLEEIGAIGRPTTVVGTQEHAADCRSKPVTKAIVFSQFWQHIRVIAAHLASHGCPFAWYKKDMPANDKSEALHTFQHDADVGVLLLDESGALGLDLSFASHVFLMEPIADRSLEQQVISRAHRMGAKQDVRVEVLVMRDTAEQAMVKLASPSGTQSGAAGTSSGSSAQSRAHSGASSVQAAPPVHDGMAIPHVNDELAAKVASAGFMKDQSVWNMVFLSLRKVMISELPDYEDDGEDTGRFGQVWNVFKPAPVPAGTPAITS